MVQSVALDHSAKYQGSQNPRVMISGNKTSCHEVDSWGFHGYCTVHEQEFMHQLFPSFPDGPQNMYCTLPNNKKETCGWQTTSNYQTLWSNTLNIAQSSYLIVISIGFSSSPNSDSTQAGDSAVCRWNHRVDLPEMLTWYILRLKTDWKKPNLEGYQVVFETWFCTSNWLEDWWTWPRAEILSFVLSCANT